MAPPEGVPFPSHIAPGVLLPQAPACSCPSDLAPAFGVSDLGDALAFLGSLTAHGFGADLAGPYGVIDFDDALAFLTSCGSGCP